MSSSKTKVVSEINLEEFERRLRAAGAPQGVEDPLMELTRLVNSIAAERQGTEKIVEFSPARTPRAERVAPLPEPTSAPRPALASPPASASPPAAPASPPALTRAPAPVDPPTALAGTETGDEEESVARAHEPVARQEAPVAFEEDPAATPPLRSAIQEGVGEELEPFEAAPLPSIEAGQWVERPRRPRSWYLKIGGLIGVGCAMAAGAAVMRIGVTSAPKSPPMILAADTPSKVAPPSEAAVQSPGDTGALLLKDSATPAPVKIVSNEEQPVDLSARAPAPQPPAPAPEPPASSPSGDSAPVASTSNSPVAPTSDTPIVAPSESLGGSPASAPPAFPSAKRVKTVSVRPDGTLISVDSAPESPPLLASLAPAAPPSVKAPDSAAAAAALPATPKVDLPPKAATKSSARVATAKTDTTVPADDEFGTLQPNPAPHPEKAVKPPTKLRPPATAADAGDAAAAPAPAGKPASSSDSGGWAVQLAAPRSESEAEAAIARLKTKYADDLGAAGLAVHKAEVRGATVYRVQAGGMSKADAVALCSKLKASGGDCFVAKH